MSVLLIASMLAVSQPSINSLIVQEKTLYGECKMSPHSASCKKADVILDQLLTRGICYGKITDASEADYTYHQCGKASIQMQHPKKNTDEYKCNHGDQAACLRL